ncbi:UvrB/UvrC motif-containing protein [PVC group bacterium]|nr:UvrB/UvrC motif-containing protein [PVC group bacterium]
MVQGLENLAVRYEIEEQERKVVRETGENYDVYRAIQQIEKEMLKAAKALEFERAAVLRDEMEALKKS